MSLYAFIEQCWRAWGFELIQNQQNVAFSSGSSLTCTRSIHISNPRWCSRCHQCMAGRCLQTGWVGIDQDGGGVEVQCFQANISLRTLATAWLRDHFGTLRTFSLIIQVWCLPPNSFPKNGVSSKEALYVEGWWRTLPGAKGRQTWSRVSSAHCAPAAAAAQVSPAAAFFSLSPLWTVFLCHS